jgi:hypothetical protein
MDAPANAAKINQAYFFIFVPLWIVCYQNPCSGQGVFYFKVVTTSVFAATGVFPVFAYRSIVCVSTEFTAIQGVGVGVMVGVMVIVGVAVNTGVDVRVGVTVGVAVMVGVGVTVGVYVGGKVETLITP